MIQAIVRGEALTLDQGEWFGASPSLLEKLEAETAAAIAEVWGSDPAPELTVAKFVVNSLGGRITEYVPDEDDDPNLPPVIYSSAP